MRRELRQRQALLRILDQQLHEASGERRDQARPHRLCQRCSRPEVEAMTEHVTQGAEQAASTVFRVPCKSCAVPGLESSPRTTRVATADFLLPNPVVRAKTRCG